jgi:predicted ATPase/DNA-binding CsgD family transcriptional regulator
MSERTVEVTSPAPSTSFASEGVVCLAQRVAVPGRTTRSPWRGQRAHYAGNEQGAVATRPRSLFRNRPEGAPEPVAGSRTDPRPARRAGAHGAALLVTDRPSASRGNLPAEMTSFIGRRHELHDVKAALGAARLVTLVGPGGVGKTRLALRSATDLRRGLADGAWIVELDGLRDQELVTQAVMMSLGLRDEVSGWPVSRLIEYLAPRRLLLVLDNCEHVVDACAVLADALLREAPSLRILATSRQPLGVRGETVIPVGPLSVPDADGDMAVDQLVHSEAVALLLERAREAGAPLEITATNRAAVIELARRLDGMPLAIELASVRLRTLGLEQVVERLNDRFHLLVGGSRTAPRRQQTLEATIAWSHDLLGEDDRAVLRRLSVFAGSFSLEAADRVGQAGRPLPTGVMDVLTNLVERSFVIRDRTPGRARYRLHETMREFALVRLREAGEDAVALDAHRIFFSGLCRSTEFDLPRLDEASQVAALDEMDLEAENVRVALRTCLADPDGADLGLAMAAGLAQYWRCRAVSEGAHWIDVLLARQGRDDRVRSHALYAKVTLAVVRGDHETGLETCAEAERVARRLQDDALLVRILANRAALQVLAGDVPAARMNSADATALAGRLGDDLSYIAAAQSEAFLAFLDGDYGRMRDVGLAAAARSRECHEAFMLSTHLTSAGMGSLMLGDHAAAEAALTDALRASVVVDDRPGLVMRLEVLATAASMAGNALRAAGLLGASEALRLAIGAEPSPFTMPLVEKARQACEAVLGDSRFRKAFEAGTALDREGAVALALGTNVAGDPRPPKSRTPDVLGKREREVAELVAEGLSNKEIAARLFLSERTVETHVYNILNKLGFNSRVAIASWVSSAD